MIGAGVAYVECAVRERPLVAMERETGIDQKGYFYPRLEASLES